MFAFNRNKRPYIEVFTFYCQYGDRLNTSYMSNAKMAKMAKDTGMVPHLVPSAGMDILYTKAAARDGVLGKLVFWVRRCKMEPLSMSPDSSELKALLKAVLKAPVSALDAHL